MPSPFDGGTVLLTGASAGIGEALAKQLAPRAKTLVLVARRKDRLEALRTTLLATNPKLSVLVVPCDLNDRAATDAMLATVQEQAGDVEVLINNAGFGDLGVFDLVSWEKTERMLQLNMLTPAYLTHRLVPSMVKKGRGGILNVSSGWGLVFGPALTAYVGTKHFLSSFTEGLRLDLAGTGVFVVQVCPGPVQTEFVDTIGNFTKLEPPSLLTISAEQCAREAIAGFDKNRAIVMPGFLMRWITRMGMLTPRWLLRLFYAPVAKRLRLEQSKAKAGG